MLAQLSLTHGGIRPANQFSLFRSRGPSSSSKNLKTTTQHARAFIQVPKRQLHGLLQTLNTKFVSGLKARPILDSQRSFHTSLVVEKKSTTALRRERAAATPLPPSAMRSGVLFEKDSRTFFLVLTGVAALQAVFFLTSAEFYWQYDVSIVDGMNAGSDFLSRLAWPAFFVGISTFLPITRYFFGTRYVNKLELLQDKTVNVWTYDILARPTVSINAPVDAFKYGAFNDQGDYYKFKIRGHRWFFIMDKKGSVPDPQALYEVANGKLPQVKF